MEPLRYGHTLELLEGGQRYFPALLQALGSSHTEVRLETYIFEFDATGVAVASALEQAARRGVRVYLIMDGIGTPAVPTDWQARWHAAGVMWAQFSPLGRWGLLFPSNWRRMHRKLCVVDQQVAFCGGINILDDFNDPHFGPLESARFDFAVKVVGPLVRDAHQVMEKLWRRLQAARELERGHILDATHSLRRAPLRPVQAAAGSADLLRPPAVVSGFKGALAALLTRDNVRNRSRIERAYRRAIARARHDVVIANAYFLPGGKMRRALMHAARRGVRVRLLLQGRYEYFMQFHASKPVYGALLAAGVEIYEYHAGFLHSKVAVVDGHWATVGSSNLDPLSLLLAREADILVDDPGFSSMLQKRLGEVINDQGRRLDTTVYQNRPFVQRILDLMAYAAMRLSLFLTGNRY